MAITSEALIESLMAGDKIVVTVATGEVLVGDFEQTIDGVLVMSSQASRKRSVILLDGITELRREAISGPCSTTVGNGRRCSRCRYLSNLH